MGQQSWLSGDFREAHALLEESRAIWLKLGADGERGLAGALVNLGLVASSNAGDNKTSQSFFERSFELYQKHGDQWGMAFVLLSLGGVLGEQIDNNLALSLLEQSLDMFHQLGDVWGMGRASQWLGQHFMKQGNYEKARAYFDQHLRIDEGLHFKQGTMIALQNLGTLYRHQGDYAQAERFYQKGLIICREYGGKWELSNNFYYLGLLALHRNDYLLARQYFIDYFNLARTIYAGGIDACDLFTGLAAVAAGTSQPERAAKLYGAAQAVIEMTDYRIPPFDLAEFDRHIQFAREQLGEVAFEVLAAEGRAMTIEQAVTYALENNR